jgi:hypothetical protein
MFIGDLLADDEIPDLSNDLSNDLSLPDELPDLSLPDELPDLSLPVPLFIPFTSIIILYFL